MKLRGKLSKLTQPVAYRRGWGRAQRYIFRLPLWPLRADIDQRQLREIQQRYAGSPAGYAKYANIDPRLRLNRGRIQDLKLHTSRPKHVLDRSEEHTSELQSQSNLVCRLLLEKKKRTDQYRNIFASRYSPHRSSRSSRHTSRYRRRFVCVSRLPCTCTHALLARLERAQLYHHV